MFFLFSPIYHLL